MLIASDFPHYTVTASSTLVHHPVSNVQLPLNPGLTWRASVSNTDAWLLFYFGTAVPLDGAFLNHVNMLSVTWQSSTDGVGFTDLATSFIPVDRRVHRRKAYHRWAGFNHPYLRALFPLSGLLSLGAPYVEPTFGELEFGGGETSIGSFELGALVPVRTVVDLDQFTAEWPLRYTPRGGSDLTDFLGGGFEIDDLGPRYLEAVMSLSGPRTEDVVGGGGGALGEVGIGEAPLGGGGFSAATGGLPQLGALQEIGIGQPLLVFEDLGDVSKAYLFRRIDAEEEAEDFSMVTKGGWALREAIRG